MSRGLSEILFKHHWPVWPFRYNCNRYNEDDAKAARDAQEVIKSTFALKNCETYVNLERFIT